MNDQTTHPLGASTIQSWARQIARDIEPFGDVFLDGCDPGDDENPYPGVWGPGWQVTAMPTQVEEGSPRCWCVTLYGLACGKQTGVHAQVGRAEAVEHVLRFLRGK